MKQHGFGSFVAFAMGRFLGGGLVVALLALPLAGRAAVSTHAVAVPAALRPVVYRALAHDAGPAYRVGAHACVVLPGRSLRGCFRAAGVYFELQGHRRLGLHLAAYGRAQVLRAVAAVAPEISANRVRYAHGALSEWWRILPQGFEQGFTLTRRPTGTGDLILVLDSTRPVKQTHHGLAFGRLHYGKLVVTDAAGHLVPATLTGTGRRIRIAVNDAGVRYPLTIDPLVWLEQKVTASVGAAYDNFGYAVALSGSTALIGERGVNAAPGAVYVFTESNGSWSQTQKLTASNGAAGDSFGGSVALSGTTALIGAAGGSANQGAAYVFTDSGGSWSKTQKLTASNGAANDYFGSSVALSGTTALIGALGATVGGNANQGAAYVFTDSNGIWSQAQKLTASNGAADDLFGYSVALSGTTTLIGAAYATVGGNANQGAAYVFTDSGGVWSQTTKLTASDGAGNDNFGTSVALSGTTVLIGAWDATVGGNVTQGAAYVFTESGGTWSQAQKLTASAGAANNEFGWSVALSGSTALIGAPNATVGGNAAQGATYFYGQANLALALNVPVTAPLAGSYTSQAIVTNAATTASPAVVMTLVVPAAVSFISATATQGSCSQAAGVVTCTLGSIAGNGGRASANVQLKVTGSAGMTIANTAGISQATPALTASAPTLIATNTGGGGALGLLGLLALLGLAIPITLRWRR